MSRRLRNQSPRGVEIGGARSCDGGALRPNRHRRAFPSRSACSKPLLAVLAGQRIENIAQALLVRLRDLDAALEHAVERVEPGLQRRRLRIGAARSAAAEQPAEDIPQQPSEAAARGRLVVLVDRRAKTAGAVGGPGQLAENAAE